LPELPEVESLCRQLDMAITGITVQDMLTLDTAKLADFFFFFGQQVKRVRRQGKHIVLSFADGEDMIVHLRMTGRFLWQTQTNVDEPPKHTRMIMVFSSGRIAFIDPRRFMTVIKGNFICQENIMDPLADMTPQSLAEKGKTSKRPIKTFLMDQAIMAGIGNIYACEILHHAGISPSRPVNTISAGQWLEIAQITRNILERAIACRGSSISDWRDFYGNEGTFHHELCVYGRKGLPCPVCQNTILYIPIGGRGSYFCPQCQT
jgi:formamidopyrimidine-DNA glycosylase